MSNRASSFLVGAFGFRNNLIRVTEGWTNSAGELRDWWDTPYRIEIAVQTNFVIRSAGRDRKFGDKNDIVFDSSKNDFAKP